MIPHRAEYVSQVGVTIHHCPIGGCPWTIAEPLATPSTIPIVDGVARVDMAVAERAATVDTAIRRHADGHTTREWAEYIDLLRTGLDAWETRFGPWTG